MEHAVSATEARIHFGELMRTAVEEGEPIVIERGGKAHVVVLSMDAYRRLLEGQRLASWQDLVDRARTQIRSDLAGRELPPLTRSCSKPGRSAMPSSWICIDANLVIRPVAMNHGSP